MIVPSSKVTEQVMIQLTFNQRNVFNSEEYIVITIANEESRYYCERTS